MTSNMKCRSSIFIKIFLLTVCMVFLFTGFSYAASGNKKFQEIEKQETDYIEGELIVKFKEGTKRNKKDNLHNKYNSKKVKEFKKLKVEHIKLDPGTTVDDAIAQYKADPDVEFAAPNYYRYAHEITTTTDPLFDQLWGLRNTGQTGGTADADMDASDAWDFTIGSPNVVVAVLDSGIDYNHPDIIGNLWTNASEAAGDANADGYPGVDGVDDDGDGLIDEDSQGNSRFEADGITPNPLWVNDLVNDDDENGYEDDIYGINAIIDNGDPMDDNGHGTHVSGTIGAVGDNGIGVAGVNWDVQIISCKGINSAGLGLDSYFIECLDYVETLKNNGVNVVATNNSWGGGPSSQALYDAIQSQMDNGILFIASAGNSYADNDDVGTVPSSYDLPNIISVAATDHDDLKADFSNWGRRSVDVGAPGVDIVSLRAYGTDMYGDNMHYIPDGDMNAEYYIASGTSMAAPHVTGLAALLKDDGPARDWIAIRNLILSGGDQVSNLPDITTTGKRINAHGSLTCVDSPVVSILEYASDHVIGVPFSVSALSINCESPVGPVWLNGTIELMDDGIGADLIAGDGIFTGTYTPTQSSEVLIVSSASGTDRVRTPHVEITSYYYMLAGINLPFSETLEATGGLPPYTWSVTAGNLPGGLAMDPSGVISGVPTEGGFFNFTVQVEDAESEIALMEMVIKVIEDEVWLLSETGYQYTGYGVDTDANGDIYVVGTYRDITSYYQLLLIKYDQAGSELWRITGPGSGGGRDVAVGPSGNIYVTGSAGTSGITQKYDPSGILLWSQSFPNSSGTKIAVDDTELIYVTGYQVSIVYDSDGNEIWNNTDTGLDIGFDSGGNAYVLRLLHNGSDYDVEVTKYDTAGQIITTWTYDGGQNEAGIGIVLDGNDNIYVAGYSYSLSTNSNFRHTTTFKFDPNFNLLWSNVHDNEETHSDANDITLDTNGNVYVTGQIDYPATGDIIQTLVYDPSGNLLWGAELAVGAQDEGEGIAVDDNGNVYVTGHYQGWGNLVTVKYSQKITTDDLPYGIFGDPYNIGLEARAGILPYTWSVIAGSLPDGLSLNSTTGEITGVATATGTFNFTIQLTDSMLNTVTKDMSIITQALPVEIWTASYDSGGTDYGYGTAADSSGNLYVTGSTDSGIITVKYDPSGNVIWAKTFGGSTSGRGIFVDGNGDVYVTGTSGADCLTLKYDADGNEVWAVPSIYDGGFGTDYCNSVTGDNNGDIYVAGHTYNGNDKDFLTIKYDSAGNEIWVKNFDFMDPLATNPADEANDIIVDQSGNVFVIGQSKPWTNYLYYYAQVVKYDTDGTFQWEQRYGGPTHYSWGIGADFDAAGDIYLVGGYQTDYTQPVHNFITKIDPYGNVVWEKQFDQTVPGERDYIKGMLITETNGIEGAFVAGYYMDGSDYDYFLHKLDLDGKLIGTRTFDGGSTDQAFDVATDGNGNVYVTGNTFAGSSWDYLTIRYGSVGIPAQALLDGVVGVSYSNTLTAEGGFTPYTWAVINGSLPDGLTLNGSTGEIAGTPTAGGTFNFTVEAADAAGDTATANLSIRVTTTYYIYSASGCSGKTYKSGPRYGVLGTVTGDCAIGDTVRSTFRNGPRDLLVGYLANGGYAEDMEITGLAAGNDLSFLAEGSAGNGYVNLVEINPVDNTVIQTLSSVYIPLTADVMEHVTDISGLSGTVSAGNTFGIMLSMDSVSRDANTVRWGETNGGPGLEQWFSVMELPAVSCVPTGNPDDNCDGIDDDCNGTADDAYVPTPTACGTGVCGSTGQFECQGGTVVDTCTPGSPQNEGPEGDPTCADSLDNDCDGYTDNLDSDCVCVPTGLPDDNCDGIDDDCNGTPDDAYVPTPTSCGDGICASSGQLECQGGTLVDTCQPGTPQTEGPAGDPTCADSLDNDCDIQTDEDDSDCQQPSCSDYTDKNSCRAAGCNWDNKNKICS